MILWIHPSSTIDFASAASSLALLALLAHSARKTDRQVSIGTWPAPDELVDLTELTPLSPGAFQRLAR